MGRFARVVIPGVAHHVTQRGARRLPVFFSHRDYDQYKIFLAVQALRHDLEIWAYCLMPNHVHLIAVPSSETALARPIGAAHRRYAQMVNRRSGWTGHLWQERFASVAMDERHLLAATRYVLLNPVRAGLVERPEQWRHSSARAHLFGELDCLATAKPLARRIEGWQDFLEADETEEHESIRRHTRIGRPLGSESFVKRLENLTGRQLQR